MLGPVRRGSFWSGKNDSSRASFPTCRTLLNRKPARRAPHSVTMPVRSKLLEGCKRESPFALQCMACVAHTEPTKAVVPCSTLQLKIKLREGPSLALGLKTQL